MIMNDSIFVNRLKRLRFLLFLLCYAVGLTIFVTGFIPKSVSKLPPSAIDSLFRNCIHIVKSPQLCQSINFNSSYARHYEKVIVIIIDALRADFIPSVSPNPEFNTSLPFMEALIQNKTALPFINKGHSPTVTLPRIRSLLTGGLSNFMDVLTNLNAAELNEDNFLHQAKLKNLKSIFYGDDTWLKLFPKLFIRSEGTHSFFVSDFQEVDTNVTRHLETEFSSHDWDIMILHYLGVDHIGHAYGPHSQHLAPKLKEMDRVIELIYSKLSTLFQIPSLIVVCGDHGMTASGSHGGVSKSELLTPLIFINTNQSKYQTYKTIKTVDQVDFAATISVLLGLPIPVNSFGTIIPDVLHFSGLTPRQVLSATFYNLIQLFEVHKSVFPTKEEMYIEHIRNIIQNHSQVLHIIGLDDFSADEYQIVLKSYILLLDNIKQDLLANVDGYNEICILLGLIILWLSLVYTIISFLVTCNDSTINQITICAIRSIIYNRINLFIFPSVLFVLMHYSNFLHSLGTLFIIYTGIYLLCLIIWILKSIIKILHLTFMERICGLLFLLHALSLFSSSYIEEEHQVWYFSISTILTLYFVKCVLSMLSFCLTLQTRHPQLKPSCLWNVVCLDKNSDKAGLLFLLLISHRILRSWNQTGDKWQHLPDITDWLDKEENATYTSLLVIVSQILIVYYLKMKQRSFTYYTMCLGTSFIYLYKCHNEMLSSFFKIINVNLVIIPWLVYILIASIMISTFQLNIFPTVQVKISSTFTVNLITAWMLLAQLLGRTHNIPLIAATLLQEHYLYKVMWTDKTETSLSLLCYLQMAMCSFFYLGNSNSLSTIDVFSGYIGLLTYKPVIVGFLIMCNTYSTFILWLLFMIYRMQVLFSSTKFVKSSVTNYTFYSFPILFIYKLFVLAMYCIVMYLMKHHLFVLTVFAPKLFYEICHVMLFFIFTFSVLVSEFALV